MEELDTPHLSYGRSSTSGGMLSPSSLISPSTGFSYPITPMLALDMDPVSFSESFHESLDLSLGISELMEEMRKDRDNLRLDKAGIVPSQTVETDMSYDIERITNIREVDPHWTDDEISEIVVLSGKPKDRSILPNNDSSEAPVLSSDCSQEPELKRKATIADYDLLKALGTGTCGKVLLTRNRNDSSLYAIKYIRKLAILRKGSVAHVQSEQACLQTITTLAGPFLPNLYRSFQDKEKLYFVMDFYAGGDLLTHLSRCGKFHPDRARFYASELSVAISFIHSIGIVHRDIKPENIMLEGDGHLVLTDFGLSRHLPEGTTLSTCDETLTTCGTREYRAPEMIMGWKYDFAVDCWSFGILLYMMHFGRHPFEYNEDPASRQEMEDRIVKGPTTFPVNVIDPPLLDLITKSMERNPLLRLGTLAIQQHNYFTAIDWSIVRSKRYEVPFLPDLNHAEIDLRYFDEEFVSMDLETNSTHPSDEIAESELVVDPDTFDGFSFAWNPLAPTIQSHQDTEAHFRGKSLDTHASTAQSSLRPIRSILKSTSMDFSKLTQRFSKLTLMDNESNDSRCADGSLAVTPKQPRKLQKGQRPGSTVGHRSSFFGKRMSFSSLIFNKSADQNKLRKKSSQPTSTVTAESSTAQLHNGVSQSGLGIGYTHTAMVTRSRISLNSVGSCFGGLGLNFRHKRGKGSEPDIRAYNQTQAYLDDYDFDLDWLHDETQSTATYGIPEGLGPRIDSISDTSVEFGTAC